MAFNLNIVTINIRGLRSVLKRVAIFEHLHKFYSNHIVFLQETHSHVSDELLWRDEWGGNIEFNHFQTDSRGVCILFPKHMDVTLNNRTADYAGRIIALDVVLHEQQFTLVNIYAPTKSNDRLQCIFLEDLCRNLENYDGSNLVIGGDFNMTLNPELDKNGKRDDERTSVYRTNLLNMINDLDLIEIWRNRHKGVKQFTWVSPNGKIKSRLDFFLISSFLEPLVRKTNINSFIKSDHKSVSLSIQSQTFQKRGPGFWKFNSDLLSNLDYIDGINNILTEAKIKYINLMDKGLKWDIIKCDIRSYSVMFSKIKAKQVKDKELDLRDKINALEKKEDEDISQMFFKYT